MPTLALLSDLDRKHTPARKPKASAWTACYAAVSYLALLPHKVCITLPISFICPEITSEPPSYVAITPLGIASKQHWSLYRDWATRLQVFSVPSSLEAASSVSLCAADRSLGLASWLGTEGPNLHYHLPDP